MMKHKYLLLLLLLIFAITGCDDENESDFKEVRIEKYFPYYYERESIDNTDNIKTELFHHKILLINSLNQLNDNPLFEYCSESFKENLVGCDFDRYTLILTTTITFDPVFELECGFRYYKSLSEYECNKILYIKNTPTFPPENIYFVANAFLVKKIPDNSNLSLTISSLPKK